MSDAAPQQTVAAPTPLPAPATEARTLVLIVYALYLGALFCGGVSGLAGVILAYIKRDETIDPVWRSHYENAIHAFWVWFGLAVVGILTVWLLIGFALLALAFIYFLYRTIKGLVYAIDGKPYV